MLRSIILVAALVLLTAVPAVAQEPTPMPAEGYRAGLAAFEQALAASNQATSDPPTVAETVSRLESQVREFEAEYVRLQAITPEPCYADAHAAYLAYVDFAVDAVQVTMLPAFADADDIFDAFPVMAALSAEVESRFPAFFVLPDPEATPEPDVTQMGPSGVFHHLRAFDTLNTCEGPTASPVPSLAAE